MVDTNYRKDHNQQAQIETQFGKSIDALVGDPETETYDMTSIQF